MHSLFAREQCERDARDVALFPTQARPECGVDSGFNGSGSGQRCYDLRTVASQVVRNLGGDDWRGGVGGAVHRGMVALAEEVEKPRLGLLYHQTVLTVLR